MPLSCSEQSSTLLAIVFHHHFLYSSLLFFLYVDYINSSRPGLLASVELSDGENCQSSVGTLFSLLV